MKKTKTVEPQYKILYDVVEKHGVSQFGIMANESWNQDPKRTLFTLARYKFVAKMFSGKNRVLEIGCADAFGTRLVQQEVKELTAIDFDPLFIEDAKSRYNPHWPMKLFVHDMLSGSVPGGPYDAVFSLDVLEHINPRDEKKFINNIIGSIKQNTPVIIGMPSYESQVHASPQSKEGHVNCKSGKNLKKDLENYFENVFIFSMNDEIIHTGFFPMAHYLMAICIGKK